MAPLLYIAAPYSSNPIINTHNVVLTASAIYDDTEWVPLVPHLTLLWDLIDPHSDVDHWYGLDLMYLEHCDALVRLPGESMGADREVAHAELFGIKVIPFSSLPFSVRRYWPDEET